MMTEGQTQALIRALPAVQPDAREAALLEEAEIDALRLKAFRTNATADRDAYFKAVSVRFQNRHGRALPAVQADAALLEVACIAAHDAYEAAAHAAGWATNPQSRKPWAEVPEANKVAMRAGIGAALALIDKPAHVNKTPKSEHEVGNVLTPTMNDWQPIASAPKDRVIDLWSVEGGRYPDAVWGVCGDTEGWTDANDHRSLEGGAFTHWRDRPAPPATKGGGA